MLFISFNLIQMTKYIIFCCTSVRVYFSCGFLQQQLYYSSSRIRNPYDVLGLKSTCSVKDVKEAYIKLCKELHPDMKPGDTSQHKKFVELNDAYTSLLNSKCKKKNFRRRGASSTSNYSNVWRSSRENESKEHWTSEKAWYEREEYQKYYQQHDEDNLMSKNRRKANIWVIAGCFILMIVGSVLYLSAYSYATKYTTNTVAEKSKKISESYHDVRQNLENKGKNEQLDDLKKRWTG